MSSYIQSVIDFRVFQNCLLYNPPKTEIGKIAINLQTEFEKACKENNAEQFLKTKADSNPISQQISELTIQNPSSQ